MRTLRFYVFLLVSGLSMTAYAQPSPLPMPGLSGERGPRSVNIPYENPFAAQTRGSVFTVTTTADEDDACDPNDGAGLSLREALELCSAVDANATVYVPAGTYIPNSVIIAGYNNLILIGEDPAATIIDADAHAFSIALNGGVFNVSNMVIDTNGYQRSLITVTGTGSVALQNVTLQSGSFGLHITPDVGGIDVEVTSSLLTNMQGSAIHFNSDGLSGSTLNLVETIFFYNTSNTEEITAGAAVFAQDVNIISIADSLFTTNIALEKGGAVYIDNSNSVSINDSDFILNYTWDDTPTTQGGAAWLNADLIQISKSNFYLNDAYSGAGIYLHESNATIEGSIVEENFVLPPKNKIDCYTDEGYSLVSLGNNLIGGLRGCTFVAHSTDLFGNLLHNPNFDVEPQGSEPDSPIALFWNVVQSGGKRFCPAYPQYFALSEQGICIYRFKSPGAKIAQTVNLTSVIFNAGDELTLYAEVKGKPATALVVQAKVKFSDATPQQKLKLKFNGAGATAGYDSIRRSAILNSGAVSSIKVEAINNGSGKTDLDRVYLFVSETAIPRVDILPPPAAPDGLRGKH